MQTEHWSLLISGIALAVSIGIPIWQYRRSTARLIASKRTLLLQRILSAKSVTFVSMHELIWLLKRHGGQMDEEQRGKLQAMVPRMREHHDGLEQLHAEWSDYNDGASIADIERELSHVDQAYSEAEDTAKLIENGRQSYEDT